MLPGMFFSALNWVVPGSLETAVSKVGSNHCLFESVCWQPKQQQAQPSRSSKHLVTLSDPQWENWKERGVTSRENSWSTTCTNMHLTGLTWVSLGKGSGKPEASPMRGVSRGAPHMPAPQRLRCQKPPASQSCFIPSHFVKSKPHQLQGGDCTGLLSQDQHLWPYFHTTGDTYSFPTFWSMANS